MWHSSLERTTSLLSLPYFPPTHSVSPFGRTSLPYRFHVELSLGPFTHRTNLHFMTTRPSSELPNPSVGPPSPPATNPFAAPSRHPIILGDQLSNPSLPSPPPSNGLSMSEASASSALPSATPATSTTPRVPDTPTLTQGASLHEKAKRGRDGYWQVVQQQKAESAAVVTPTQTGSGLSLVFKIPPNAGGEGSRGSSPASTTGSMKKRRTE